MAIDFVTSLHPVYRRRSRYDLWSRVQRPDPRDISVVTVLRALDPDVFLKKKLEILSIGFSVLKAILLRSRPHCGSFRLSRPLNFTGPLRDGERERNEGRPRKRSEREEEEFWRIGPLQRFERFDATKEVQSIPTFIGRLRRLNVS